MGIEPESSVVAGRGVAGPAGLELEGCRRWNLVLARKRDASKFNCDNVRRIRPTLFCGLKDQHDDGLGSQLWATHAQYMVLMAYCIGPIHTMLPA